MLEACLLAGWIEDRILGVATNDWQTYGFLFGVYSNLFGRPLDASGQARWAGRVDHTLEQGGFVGSVLVDIISGTQNSAGGPQDITRLMGKVAVSLAYVAEQQLLGTHWSPDQLAEAREMVQPCQRARHRC